MQDMKNDLDQLVLAFQGLKQKLNSYNTIS